MRFLPTSLHGAIDYAWGALLIAAPFALAFAADRLSFWIAVAFGVGAILYSLVTAYELGAIRIIPMPAHLALDAVAGLALAAMPFLLPLDDRARWPFIGFGLFAVVASVVTKTVPGTATASRTEPR